MKRFLVSLVCLCMIISAVSCAKAEKTYEEQKGLYAEVIAQYTALLNEKLNGGELPEPNTEGMDEREAKIAEALTGIVNACKDEEALKRLGYGFKDLDGNGTPELLLLTKRSYLRAIFTLADEKPMLLEANYGMSTMIFGEDGLILIERFTEEGNIQSATGYVCRVDGDKMVYEIIYGEIFDAEKKETVELFKIVDGVRTVIDAEEFKQLRKEKVYLPGDNQTHFCKLQAPYVHLPLEDTNANEELPLADFSSYSAILETYKAITESVENYNYNSWLNGEYDNLFRFSNDTDFEYYNRLLYMAQTFYLDLGYDEIDLNGDGRDELLLLDENYNIKAIFTQKDGVPVLLEVLKNGVCWLDSDGYIHVDNDQYSELRYSLCELTKDGDYSCLYTIILNDEGRYLKQGSSKEKISFERSLELYDEYRRYSEPFEPNEHTRIVSKLTYTPIKKSGEDVAKSAISELWYKSTSLEKTTGNEYGAYGQTFIRFGTPDDSQVKVEFKYKYIYYTPDPERENYAIDNSEVSYLTVTAHSENGEWRFNENGIKGRIELGSRYIWLIIEESTDSRFAVGYHCLEKYDSDSFAEPFEW